MNTDVMIVPPEVPVAVQLPGLIGSVWARRARASSNGARLVGLCMLAVVIGAAVFVPLLATQSSGAIGLGTWRLYARLVRGQCLALRDSDFVLAARLLGLPPRRILFRHLLPPILRVVAAYAVADAVTVITVVASLSYIGVGIQSPA